jgi:uncharacterized membrane protein
LTAVADAALFLHLVGSLLFVAGIIVAGVAHRAARRRHRASEVALLLGVARTGALLVAAGAVLVLAFGLWLVDLRGHSLGEAWIAGALTLFALALVLGALGGRRPRLARLRAGRLARDDDSVDHELRRLLDDRASAAANYAAVLVVLAILALMIWQPS